ncbi:MAG: hypothetical protein AB8B97_25370 [Granulosicoccus sp.]
MKSILHVGVVIESPVPAAWVNQILQQIDAHHAMRLSVGLHDKHLHTTMKPAAKVQHALADWLLENIIDIPQFTHNPEESEDLPAALDIHDLAASPDALASCDVILSVMHQQPPWHLLRGTVPVWSAGLPTMDVRIKHNLLDKAPFLWIHLWALQCTKGTDLVDSQRIASHALPCQTYSISDLRRLSYSALPGVFMSRLVWLANRPDGALQSIEIQNDNQGVFDTDRRQALRDIGSSADVNSQVASIPALLMLFKVMKLLLRQLYERVHRKVFSEHWQLAVSHNPTSTSLHDIATLPVHAYTSLAEPDDVMWADPHLCEYQDDVYVFFEKMHEHNENAHIAYARLNEQGTLIDSGLALAAEHHLSFPHVFTHEDNHYMIPETASLRSVNLYKATRFPDQWVLQQTLLTDINAADTVVFQHQGRWWMFTNCQSHHTVDERDELHVYHAQKLEGPWHSHSLNPVLTGVDRSRMAGPVIHENGNLFRCSQYGAHRYGYGVNISRIDELTPDTYRESASWRILPDKGAGWSGCHTFSRLGQLTIIDRVRFSRR